jgi:hypothetical protein
MTKPTVKLTHIEALHEALTEILPTRERPAIWQDKRIYINGQPSHITVYFEFDNATGEAPEDLLDGTALKVWSNCSSQPSAWNISQAKKAKHAIMEDLADEDLCEEVCDDWQDIVL